MATYQVAWNPATKVAKIQTDGDTPGAGFTDIGAFDHTDDPDDELGLEINHVFYHHVRDLLYAQGVLDMQSLTIDLTRLTGISSVIADNTLTNAQASQITNTFTPATAAIRSVIYTTSDPAIATVSSTGLVTAGATDGTATITITSVDGGFTDTIDVTVA